MNDRRPNPEAMNPLAGSGAGARACGGPFIGAIAAVFTSQSHSRSVSPTKGCAGVANENANSITPR